MRKISWWETWLDDDMSWREANALNEAASGLDMLSQNDQLLSEQIGRLNQRDAKQNAELAHLRAAVKVLVTMLGESGAVDKTALTYRLEAAFAELEPPEPDPAVAARAGEPEPSPQPSAAPVACAGCGAMVPMSRTNITPVGNLCDPCYQKSSYSK